MILKGKIKCPPRRIWSEESRIGASPSSAVRFELGFVSGILLFSLAPRTASLLNPFSLSVTMGIIISLSTLSFIASRVPQPHVHMFEFPHLKMFVLSLPEHRCEIFSMPVMTESILSPPRLHGEDLKKKNNKPAFLPDVLSHLVNQLSS